MTSDVDALVEQGRAALARARWSDARSLFEQALELAEIPEVLDGLGQALCWLGEYRRGIPLRERAYVGYRDRGDHSAGALVAVQVATLQWLVHGNGAVASGWAGQAARMAEAAGRCVARGWVELLLAERARDPEERRRRTLEALAVGRDLGDAGLEFDALANQGRELVLEGRVEQGMAKIDEAVAAVASGIVTDVWATAEIYCKLFGVCELTADARRAGQWLRAVDAHVDRTEDLPTAGICRMHFGGILTTAGRWAEAEQQLRRSVGIHDDALPGVRHEPRLRLAELRVRQGRFEEARVLLDGHEDDPEAAQPRMRLHLVRSEPRPAIRVGERHLQRRGRGLPSVPVLSLLVDALIADDDATGARDVAQELQDLVAALGAPPLEGFAAWAEARVAAARGLDAAVPAFDRAVSYFATVELPYELGRARLGLAAHLASSDRQTARIEARAALLGFEQLGARHDADTAAALLHRLGQRRHPLPRPTGALTRREEEVLRLLCQGLSNADIATRLTISPRTAEHHVGSILLKLGATSRAQAVAMARGGAAPEVHP